MTQTPLDIPLWPPGHVPGSQNVKLTEQTIERSHSPAQHDRAWINISVPSLTTFIADKPNGCAIIIAPGGGYQRVVFDKEGFDLAPIFNAKGISVFVLKYRLPADGFAHRTLVPLQDAERAIRLVRSRASQWQLNPHCIGIMGFSAGGHVAANLATRYSIKAYPPIDRIDEQPTRPDFAALLYPVITMNKHFTHQGTRERLLGDTPTEAQIHDNALETQVSDDTPPTFIALANDDHAVNPMNSVLFYQQLLRHHVPAEMHIFARSGHGFGVRNAKGNAKQWPELFLNWLRELQRSATTTSD
ncbi:alpha/beta hydrolase [Celerinatantimonas yamalensis]|uniref:Alpha/beta hydrolase n=1 Tax=Celerinatantimonas yamalensis TaxID=559956 RepID=A0ABW9G4X3_9GAMM